MTDKTDDISLKRQILSTIKMRFSPEVQKVKEDAIDSIVERILATAPSEEYYPVQKVQQLFIEGTGFHIIFKDMYSSLQSLLEKGRTEVAPKELSTKKVKVKGPQKALYQLSNTARKEVEDSERDSTRLFNSVIQRLFEDSEVGPLAYSEPFLKFLSFIFSRLASEYVQMLKGEISGDQLVYHPVFSSALTAIKDDLQSLNPSLFESAAISFFRDNDPEYASIKWHMAQNHYILRVIGLDEGGSLLSKEIFTNAVFYLDTNIVISALAPEEEHHKCFLALSKACERLGVEVKACKITLDELDRTVNAHLNMLKTVVDQIPEDTAAKVTSDFFEVYYEREKSDEEFAFDDVFASFLSAEPTLKDIFNVGIEDDYWFEETRNNTTTIDFAHVIAKRYADMSRRRKNEAASLHDSSCLLWINDCRETTGNNNIWFVTRDHTLPGCIPPDCRSKSLAITLDALIQWMSPITIGDSEEKDIALAYSQMITSHILPQERVFNLEDFLIFHELNMTCKELPAEDVEGCIRHIKINAPLLNPTDPTDREKLAYAVASYFADPSRKYQQNLQCYEAEISEVKSDLRKEKKQSLKKEAWLKVSHIAILFLILEIIAVLFASNYGVGANIFQRIIYSWPFLVSVVPVCLAIGWFYIGKNRLRSLGWPITKIFKHE